MWYMLTFFKPGMVAESAMNLSVSSRLLFLSAIIWSSVSVELLLLFATLWFSLNKSCFSATLFEGGGGGVVPPPPPPITLSWKGRFPPQVSRVAATTVESPKDRMKDVGDVAVAVAVAGLIFCGACWDGGENILKLLMLELLLLFIIRLLLLLWSPHFWFVGEWDNSVSSELEKADDGWCMMISRKIWSSSINEWSILWCWLINKTSSCISYMKKK